MTVLQAGTVTGVASWIDAPDLSELTLPPGVVGDAYNAWVAPSGWTTTVDGLPSGISLVSGELSGVPGQAGGFDVLVQATDEWSRTDAVELTLYVDDADVEVPDDLDTDDLDTDVEPGTDAGLPDEGTDPPDTNDLDDTASVDVQPAGGCSMVSAPMFLLWPALGFLVGLRRRR
jgi:hypothetical protein